MKDLAFLILWLAVALAFVGLLIALGQYANNMPTKTPIYIAGSALACLMLSEFIIFIGR